MEIKNSNSTSNINCKKCSKKFGIIETSYSISESNFRNKVIKKNNSHKTFNKNNLKLYNNINNNISKAQSERRVLTTLSSDEIERIKKNILQQFEEYKNKNISIENKIIKSIHTNETSNGLNRSKENKRNKKNKVENILNKIEKKFEKYNKENMAYKIYHDYQKLNIYDEGYEDYNFLERMELYSIKKRMKEKTIDDYIRLKSPKLPDSKIQQVFENLINDIIIRKKNKEKREKEEFNFYQFNNRDNNLKNKKVNEKEINEIVKRLSQPKKHFFYNNISKYIDKDIKFRNDGKMKEDKKNHDENNKNDNKKNKNNISKSYSMKSIKKSQQINNINNRLYYKEINKKDQTYKLFMQNVNELLRNKNNIKPQIKNDSDYISYEQLKKLRNNNKMINIKSMNNNNHIKKNNEYNFRDDNDSLNNSKNNNKKMENKNNYKGIETHNNYKKNNYNELFTFSRPQTNNSINNLKISIMIDNFFCNK